ncbi:MAG: hypothetical protein F6K41_20410 [Symploca sp. SIO3E6]|nr:hypothetical protein [Caldora sp. SIO3E6]
MSDHYLKVSGSTNVLEGSETGFIQANQSDSPSQKFDFTPNSSGFQKIQCLNGTYWKYTANGVVLTPKNRQADKFKVTFNTTSNDYEIFCEEYQGGNTPLTIAGANEFDLQNV